MTHFSLRSLLRAGSEAPNLEDKVLLPFFKIFSRQSLLRADLENDSNSLNKAFYDEFLHILGLEEREENGDRVIGRLPNARRNAASLLENTISQLRYEDDFNSRELIESHGANVEQRAFSVALELCLTWANRVLFLKLLEGQLVRFHQGDIEYKFLNSTMIGDYDDLRDLFFKVLAFKLSERDQGISQKYRRVPYLNSSLFEKTTLEKIVGIDSLNAGISIPYFSKTIIKDSIGRRKSGNIGTLEYLFNFLDAFDFGVVGGGDVREESKTIINASVLGLIFEKINGYKEGAIFTPGYVTMYMSRMVIERAVIEKFQRAFPTWSVESLDDVRNYLADRRSRSEIISSNGLIDDLKICDPAVGSGHFLVSCLNELIALKSRLGILADEEGNRIGDYQVSVDNDELIVLKTDTDEMFTYQVVNGNVPAHLQKVQKALFYEKKKIIENCLFGVDINPNSVRICQLRLWIELLKSAYYRDGDGGELETLPNIDINIKCGNSLLSRFKLDANLSDAFNRARLTVAEYRNLVTSYKTTKDKDVKRRLQDRIALAKGTFQQEALGNLTSRIDRQIDELRTQEAQADLFVLGAAEREAQARELATIRETLLALETRREKLLQNKTFLSALEWRFEFPEVLDDRGRFVGFDVIIANPPYMRIQEIEATQALQKEFYERDYATARGSYDLANLFFELAGNISKNEDSNNIFIFPHKLFNSENGEALREYLMNTRAIKHLVHFGANQVFASAITYTCVALFNNRRTEAFSFKRFPLGANYEGQLQNDSSYIDLRYADIAEASNLYGSNQWIFFDEPEGFDIFKKIHSNSVRLAQRLNVTVGLQTSKDSLYVCRKVGETDDYFDIEINPDQKVERVPVERKRFRVEKAFFRPFLMGRDVHRYQTLQTDRLVFFPYRIEEGRAHLVSTAELERAYPLTLSLVREYEEAFASREKGKARRLSEWYAYIYPKNLTKFDQEKLVSMEICSKNPNITLDNQSIYHSTTVYGLVKQDGYTASYRCLAAILNSSVFWWYLKSTGDTLQGDARRMKTNYINPFPLPNVISTEDDAFISTLVDEIVAANLVQDTVGIDRLEREIDAAIFGLYQLNDNQIATVRRMLRPDLPLA